MLGATAFKVFSDYSKSLRAAQGKLYLRGVDPALIEQFTRAGHLEASGPIEIIEATPNLGESSLAAYHQAETMDHRAQTRRLGRPRYSGRGEPL